MNTMESDAAQVASPLLILLNLLHRAHAAGSERELAFLLVNDSRELAPYRQAALWLEAGGVHTLSGIVQTEGNTPFVHWLDKTCRALHSADAGQDGVPRPVTAAELDKELAAEWSEWLPPHATWVPIQAAAGAADSGPTGGLLLAGEQPLDEHARALLHEWMTLWQHAWAAYHRPPPWSWQQLRERLLRWRNSRRAVKWWQWRPAQFAMALVAVLLFPVRLTVLAPGELVPEKPSVIRAPVDGVVGRFHVVPNQPVKAGDLLLSFDEAPLASRLEVARQALATAETEYRQLAQQVLSDPRAKAQLATLLGKIGEKRAEADFLAEQFARTQVLAPQDGIAIIDDPMEWIGKPVQTGERIMRMANPEAVEIEAWLPIGDAIPFPDEARVDLYLAADPLSSLSGRIRYIGHDAMPKPDGTFAYRVRATLDDAHGLRIGLKGTTKLHGGWVPLGYWMLRRPFATLRQFIVL